MRDKINAPDMVRIMLPTEPKPICLAIHRSVPRELVERALADQGLLTPAVKQTLDLFFAAATKRQ
jgi:hypothetical protein